MTEREAVMLTKIYDRLDELILDGRFDQVDTVLREVDLDKLDPICMLGYLSITFMARGQLEEWESLQSRARAACLARGMDGGKVERLFGQLSRTTPTTTQGSTTGKSA